MKVLITGMPRAGTSFLTRVPYLAKGMDPKSWIKNKNVRLHFEEPSVYSVEVLDINTSKDLLESVFSHNLKFSKEFVIVRHHQLLFSKELMDEFDKVIVCKRKFGSWLKSAKNHEHLSGRVKAKYSGDYKAYYEKMLNRIRKLKKATRKNDKYIFVDFDSIEESKKVFYSFLEKEKVDKIFKTHWRGSRWE